ncbi:ShlB/FhaC/HecB family hemolysin secretion/activation protein [filamentous cyanobacterium LEGE 11480]|uniref:ShlB/FhaC/HecB family hemolysin secretion/activation protein n=1 Tax=Romeriopsis navalis LEGE 11480 TaxID=2777977 RepID=A0A928VQS8_9CYAN|nr:ShlB/FhaC/HecB family hemolysin secretion/activation protein [Romeriopsis navalis]MBE9031226.1 ShlB/FhaC/HecB family hemolysin secretion/activation protein [Romeriopsis navalis LEGE 11480]
MKLSFFSGLISPIVACSAALAQTVLPPGITIPPGAENRVEETLPKTQPTPSVQPSSPPRSSPPPRLDVPTTPSFPSGSSGIPEKVKVKSIKVLGNTVLRSEIEGIIAPNIGKELTFDELLKIRSQITELYLSSGYISSGAFVPNNQDLNSGNIIIQTVEGELEKVQIAGLRRLSEGYVRKRIENAASAPLNRSRLERALQLLQIDPLISKVEAELGAGNTPGRNILRLKLTEAPTFHAGVRLDNNQSPSVGALQGNAFINNDNFLGFGDRLSLNYGRTEGLNLYGASYTLPINSKDGTLSFRYSNNNSKIIEDIFEEIGIRSRSQTYSLSLRQPLTRTVSNEFAVGLSLDLRRSKTFILDDVPFSFSEGPDEGRSQATVLRFSQDWVNRNSSRVLAARSQFSVGLDAFDATKNSGDIPDGQFFSWIGQFQWVQQLSPRTVLLSRVATQLTPDPLLSLERFSLGGADTVRGYRQNQVVSDNGIFGSIEGRIPLTAQADRLQLTPFFDWGYGWNNLGENPDPKFIASLGLGLRARLFSGVEARIDYGIPLVRSSDLEDQRFQFSVNYQFF